MGIAIISLISGMLLMSIAVWFMMPKMMLTTYKSERSFESTLEMIRKETSATGEWKIAEEFDFQKNIHDAGYGEIEKVGSVAICNPDYASRILSEVANRKVTSIMPLTIGIYQDKKNNVYVSEMNISMMGMMFGGTIAKVMNIAGKDVKRIIFSAIKK